MEPFNVLKRWLELSQRSLRRNDIDRRNTRDECPNRESQLTTQNIGKRHFQAHLRCQGSSAFSFISFFYEKRMTTDAGR